ncbi:MAG: globin family protein [Gemmatimonadota bacterium]
MTPERQALVKKSWLLIEQHGRQTSTVFYARLFEIAPESRQLFAMVDMTTQGQKLMLMLTMIVEWLDDPDQLVPTLAALARRHVGYGVRGAHYDLVGDALLWSFEQVLGSSFTPEMRQAWAEAYLLIVSIMRRAVERSSGEMAVRS